MASIHRVLVANRGEIAVRVIRACHEEGLAAVAVYSEPDRLAPHVRDADAAVLLGPAPATESYLDMQKLIAAARDTGCQAVHPGYGFLSERAAFADACTASGLIFVGPPASAIRSMGDKTEARRRMQAAGVPVVPGSAGPLRDALAAHFEAKRLGYPVLVKAVAGGGGKGMRHVAAESEIEGTFEAARREAQKAFGDGSLYLEKYLERPRHIEIQILADHRGRVAALGERECSIQRRHQKLIEEAPSVAVSPALRRRLSEAATAAAGAVGYVGAGTIEFLLAATGEFYFLEMNTRIQVEHPVTELVYGVDLVREQLRIAAGQPMRVHGATGTGGQLHPRGHAIECRITAEDPFNDFLPATGVLQYLRVPSGPGIRWDSGVEAGDEVTLFYDPLLAKLVAWGETREVAIQRMRRALSELVIVGLPTSQPFHLRVMDDAAFLKGDLDITYLERASARVLAAAPRPGLERALAVAAALRAEEQRTAGRPDGPAAGDSEQAGPSGRQAVRPSPWVIEGRRLGLRDGLE
jgi:acetyl-CoA carboxylase biotin carboxylase subunit